MANEPRFEFPERVLVIAAHADDIEFGVSGMVARWTDAGTQVTYCIVTDNSSGDNRPGTDLNWLVETRIQEAIESARIVGVTDVRFLGYKDGILEPTLELRRDLTRLIREIRPQIVVTFDPTTIIAGDFYINHPDHHATGVAATYAVFPSAGSRPIFPELLDEGYEPHDVDRLYLMLGNESPLKVDITETIDRKLEALRAHKSQIGDGEEVTKMVRQWNEEDGKEAGYAYAESVRVITLRHAPPEEESAEAAEHAAESGD